jgi:hypothetical protein
MATAPCSIAQLWNIPLTVSQVIQELAKGIVRFDFECQIEGLACGNDTKILIENNERFSNRIHDSVSKFPSFMDVGELFSKHVETLAGAGSLPNSQSRCANLSKITSLYVPHLRSATQIDASAKAVQIAPAQIQPQAVGFFFSQKIKTGPKSEVPAVPCALKPLGLVRLRWLSAELFPLPIEHSLN